VTDEPYRSQNDRRHDAHVDASSGDLDDRVIVLAAEQRDITVGGLRRPGQRSVREMNENAQEG